MYLKRHKVGEDNPKESGWYYIKTTLGLKKTAYYSSKESWNDPFADFWYSEVTERLYTEAEMKIAIQISPGYSGYTATEIEEMIISQLNKDKDK